MTRWLPAAFCGLAAGWAVPAVKAHHGQEFLVVQDSSVPSLWSGTAFGSLEWSRDGTVDEISQEPGVMLGLGSRVAIGTTVGFTGSEKDWQFESVSPFLMYEITPPSSRVRVAVIAGYHFADDSLGESTAPAPLSVVTPVSTEPAKPAGAVSAPPPPPPDPDPDPPCGPAYGPDAPPCPETAPSPGGRNYRHAGHQPPPVPTPTPAPPAPAPKAGAASRAAKTAPSPPPAPERYDGIHRHDEDHAFARLVVETDLTSRDKLIINVIGLWPEIGPPAWGYAAGYRHSFSHAVAAGLEAIGDFGDANEHELIFGGYFTPNHQWSLKMGAGLGLTDASPDVSLRAGVVWRF